MEVLSVNQFNGQFTFGNGVKGGWSSNSNTNHEETNIQQPGDQKSTNLTTNNQTITDNKLYNAEIIDEQNEETDITRISRILARELRSAKQNHLACSEVLIPSDLLQRISKEIIELSDPEPCGLRGCTIFIEFESNTILSSTNNIITNNVSNMKNSNVSMNDGGFSMTKKCDFGNSQKKIIACVRPDENIVSTFELYLTLKQENGWTDRLPQFLKNLTRGGTVVISSEFSLNKNLLYRSYRDTA